MRERLHHYTDPFIDPRMESMAQTWLPITGAVAAERAGYELSTARAHYELVDAGLLPQDAGAAVAHTSLAASAFEAGIAVVALFMAHRIRGRREQRLQDQSFQSGVALGELRAANAARRRR